MQRLGRRFAYAVGVAVVIVVLSAGSVTVADAASPGTKEYEDERRAETYRFIDNFLDGRSVDEVADDLVEVLHRTMDTEKLKKERRRREQERNFETDDEALLERLAKYVVLWVNTRLTPRTDDECKWSWGRWRCDPQCECRYKYRFGDYTPGRSCRLRTKEEKDQMGSCDPEAGNEVSLLEKLGSFIGKKVKKTWRFTSEHVIPKTDKDCRFAMAHSIEEKRMVCMPEESCSLQWKLGDFHPGRSCRLRKPGDVMTWQERAAAKKLKKKDSNGGRYEEGIGGWFGGEQSESEYGEGYDEAFD